MEYKENRGNNVETLVYGRANYLVKGQLARVQQIFKFENTILIFWINYGDEKLNTGFKESLEFWLPWKYFTKNIWGYIPSLFSSTLKPGKIKILKSPHKIN